MRFLAALVLITGCSFEPVSLVQHVGDAVAGDSLAGDAVSGDGISGDAFSGDTTCPPSVGISSPDANTQAQTGITISGTCATVLEDVLLSGDIEIAPSVPCSGGGFSATVTFTADDGPKTVVVTQAPSTACEASDSRTFERKFCSEGALVGSAFPAGTGTEPDPYIICTADQLDTLGDVSHYASHIRLGNDLTLPAGPVNTRRIGNAVTKFTGVFDGAGHVITNVSQIENNLAIGLFGGIHNATVKNLTLQGSVATSSQNGPVGVMIGRADDSILINLRVIDSRASGTVNIGGLVGYMSGGSMTGCGVIGGTVTGQSNVGGLVGSVTAAVTDSWADADVNGQQAAGGLAGTIGGSFIAGSYAIGTVTSELGSAGGILGTMNFGTLSDCYSLSVVTGVTAAGGIVGTTDGGTIERCHHTYGIISASGSSPGGIVGVRTGGVEYYNYFTGTYASPPGTPVSDTEIADTVTFETWDFGGVWSLVGSYPTLQWQP